MDIRLLGPLDVSADDGTPFPVSAPMLRATLAALALRPGQVVPAEELACRLWGDPAPVSARTTLRNYVMRLRKAVPVAPLVTASGGYRLDAGQEETDIGRFRAALQRSRELAPRAPADAARVLDSAMRLWRGTPLSDVADCPLRAAEQPRLEELRLSAIEELFELKLALGAHAAVAGELSATAHEHPLREGFTRQLMLALHRCGRTAEALAAYRAARDTLVGELGIEPGSELRALEQAILRDDPRLAAPSPAGGPLSADRPGGRRPDADPDASAPQEGLPHGARDDRWAEPAALPGFPPAIGTFVARAAELARVRDWLGGAGTAPVVCLLDGPGGVGKSTLAVRAAHDAADRFPDGLLYADLRGADPGSPPLETADALRLLLSALGLPRQDIPRDPPRAAAVYRERLRGRKVLVLLDNALDSAQVRDLLPTEAGSAALVTGRTVLTGLGGAHHLHIGTLAPAESIALVRTVAPGSAERGSREEWEELAALCGHLPLALRILAHRMASRPQWRVADWNAVLRDERSRMDELTAPDVDLRASLTVTIDQLAAGADPAGRLAAAMFPLLGAATVRSYSPDSAAAVTGCTPREAAHALERLTDAQLTTSPRPGTYTLHDLVRAAAARQASRLPEPRTRGRVADLARWYLGSMYRVNEPLAVPECFRSRSREGIARFPQGRSFTDGEEALRWADDAVDDVVLLAAQLSDPRYDTGDELAGKPLSSFAPESIWALDTYFGRRLSWHAQQRLCDLALTVGRRRGDVFARAVALGMTGKSLGQQGEGLRGAKLLEEAVELYRSLGEPLQAVRQLHNIVPCLGSAGKLTEAVDVAGQALAEAESLGFEEIRVSIVNNLARCHLLLGGLETAHRLLTGNYAATAHLPYEHTKAAGVLAEYHLARKEFEEAAHWARRSLEHAAEQPFDPYTVAEQRMSLAAAWRGLGREERARAEETAARAILEDFDHRERTRRRAHGTGGGGR